MWRCGGPPGNAPGWRCGPRRRSRAFLRHARGHRLHPLFHLTALLGLRRGEVLGLRWCDVDLTAGTLTVSHQVQEHDGRAVICPPKADSGMRTLALDTATIALLRRLRAQQPASGPSAFLFAGRGGGPPSPSHVTHAFRRVADQSGLPPVRFHDLRHGAASLSLAAGNDLKTVQALLGHHSITCTADTYTSVLPAWPATPPRPPPPWSCAPNTPPQSNCDAAGPRATPGHANAGPGGDKRVAADYGQPGNSAAPRQPHLEPTSEPALARTGADPAFPQVKRGVNGAPSGTRIPNPLVKGAPGDVLSGAGPYVLVPVGAGGRTSGSARTRPRHPRRGRDGFRRAGRSCSPCSL